MSSTVSTAFVYGMTLAEPWYTSPRHRIRRIGLQRGSRNASIAMASVDIIDCNCVCFFFSHFPSPSPPTPPPSSRVQSLMSPWSQIFLMTHLIKQLIANFSTSVASLLERTYATAR
ncbi:hypothetical protein AUEXF2481DRAFT_571652 [Aureobasidium subglaciale EXF-2481]|uniref:Uncharacterized protein n=1 Tax=Aureobasidium subglaciale (strain EXF-2481) TaxID=1043005 RepID=A0A074YU81_AURSE|nr:uncharacterized protein AUEXF2481DRAFT_571652 [Aureobasidium subglaciale EXF-2481]KEQ90406.1 hypothetical protein AUEXF2481DRAFT_571652 [Aureobasidium subglaciale EXF-2481]